MSTKIHATLGPSSSPETTIADLIRVGTDVFRINLSHFPSDDIPETIQLIHRLSGSIGRRVQVAADIRGRKLRIGPLVREPVVLTEGQELLLHGVPEGQEVPGDNRALWFNAPHLAHTLSIGDLILLDDGALRVRVQHIRDSTLVCEVEMGGPLAARSGLNVPGIPLALPPLGPKDERDLDLVTALGIDFVYLSYVETGRDVEELRRALHRRGTTLPITAKIERRTALEHLEEIITSADAVCLARGDLGTEVPLADIPFIQRGLVNKVHAAGKPAILAGEILHSMTIRRLPTRAELTDVVAAIEQRMDGFILSDETAIGIAPVSAVSTLKSLIKNVSHRLRQDHL